MYFLKKKMRLTSNSWKEKKKKRSLDGFEFQYIARKQQQSLNEVSEQDLKSL